MLYELRKDNNTAKATRNIHGIQGIHYLKKEIAEVGLKTIKT